MMILIRLAHLLWEQGVVGSNPATPTNKNKPLDSNGLFLYMEASNKILYLLNFFMYSSKIFFNSSLKFCFIFRTY